jgi:anti-sigma B factor antagonist
MEAPASFDVSVVASDDMIKVAVLGDLDCASVPRLRQVLGGVTRDPRQVVIDLRWTAFVDCAGIGALAVAHDSRRQLGRGLVLEAPSRAVSKVLELTGLNEAIPTTHDEVDACGSATESS